MSRLDGHDMTVTPTQIPGGQMMTVNGLMPFRGLIKNIQVQEGSWSGTLPGGRKIVVSGALPRGLIGITTNEPRVTGVWGLEPPLQQQQKRQPIPVVIGEVS